MLYNKKIFSSCGSNGTFQKQHRRLSSVDKDKSLDRTLTPRGFLYAFPSLDLFRRVFPSKFVWKSHKTATYTFTCENYKKITSRELRSVYGSLTFHFILFPRLTLLFSRKFKGHSRHRLKSSWTEATAGVIKITPLQNKTTTSKWKRNYD